MSEKYPNDNGWNEYQKYVLAEITRIAKNTDGLRDTTDKSNMQFVSLISQVEMRVLAKISLINQEIAALKVKASIWGGVGGAVMILMALCVWLVQQSWASTLPK